MSVISDALRDAIKASERTHYSLAKEAGIRPQMIDYFMRGEKSLSLETVDKLAPVLQLTVVAGRRKKRS
jgi:transcriptional regulator with XRE-family HTH domain